MDGENNGSNLIKQMDDFGVFPYFSHIFGSTPVTEDPTNSKISKLQHPSDTRRQLELFAPRRPVTWPCPTYGTLDRRVAMVWGTWSCLQLSPRWGEESVGYIMVFVSDLLKRMRGIPGIPYIFHFFGGKWFNFVGNTLEGRKGLQI